MDKWPRGDGGTLAMEVMKVLLQRIDAKEKNTTLEVSEVMRNSRGGIQVQLCGLGLC